MRGLLSGNQERWVEKEGSGMGGSGKGRGGYISRGNWGEWVGRGVRVWEERAEEEGERDVPGEGLNRQAIAKRRCLRKV